MDKNTQIQGKGKGQIQNNNLEQTVKSSYEKTTKELESGKSAITMMGGKLYPIMFKEVLAGEYIKSWSVDNITRIITPLVPTLDKVFITIKAFFVPHTRVWDSAEEGIAGKISGENQREPLYSNIPSYTVPKINTQYSLYNRTLLSRYGMPNYAGDTKVNALLFRGYRAIFNDFIRNKQYENPKVEWNTSMIVTAEENALKGYDTTSFNMYNGAYEIENAPTRKSYINNIKNNIGDDDQVYGMPEELVPHLDWQSRFQDLKQRIDNANKNDWDIIAEMGGTQPVTADRVQFLGEIDYELNYQQITQSAPEIDNSSPLGTTGSFSYTRANGELFSHKAFQQHGFIHILVSLNMDNNFEEATPKELLKTQIDEIYRPGLAKKEIQLIKEAEINNNTATTVGATLAYQPAWAEYKRLPRFVTGAMRTKLLTVIDEEEPEPITISQWHNFPSQTSQTVIDGNYFRPAQDVLNVLSRNNVLKPVNEIFMDDQIINMSEHKVTVALPMEDSTIQQVTKAEKTR